MLPATVRPFPRHRRIVLAALRAGRGTVPMSALASVDVTEAHQRCRQQELSFTAFVLSCVGRAVHQHPAVHAYLDWRGRLIEHRDVDIATIIEVASPTGPFPLAHLMRTTQAQSVAELTAELRRVAERPEHSSEGSALLRWGAAATRVPGLGPLAFALARRCRTLKARTGTVVVTSVGSMMGGNGFGIGTPTMTLTIVVGGMSPRPWVVDGHLAVRQVLDLTIQIDHRIVDGAPAARFGATLRTLLENPAPGLC